MFFGVDRSGNAGSARRGGLTGLTGIGARRRNEGGAMRRLTDADRAKIIRLRFDEGLSTSAISERLGWCPATIRAVVLSEKKLRAGT